MSRFVLTAQLQLQAPNNVAQVVRQIQSQLNGVNVNLNVQGSARAQRQLQQVTTQAQAATTAADRMGRAFAVSIRRFAAFSIATRTVGLFTSTLGDAVRSAIDFEREMVRVSQVTGESIGKLKFLSRAIKDLSTGLGVSSKDLLSTGQLLLQAGINAKDTEIALKTLARAALAPNFDSLSETTEGAIAILAQFQEGVGALEKQLGAINAVAGAFAVEAGDLIDVVRRAGGIFKASGGELNELIALFTSVRATTRESAESIGTGLRTIFTRIQRPKTIEFLKQFGVELVDLEGRFVGPFEAVKRLSEALSGLGEGDITFIRIAEELGGFRQIGKVLPLLQQFSTAQNALNVAQKAGNSLATDAATAQQALAIRILKVKEEFLALIRSVTETTTFQVMANTALSLAGALIKIGEAIKPLLPLLAAVAAVNFARGIGTFAGGLMRGMQSGRTYSTGGKVHHFARGGMVPGTGNRDTVPAMLQPGEFVIKKSSVNKLGASNLAAMNENRFALGGQARKFGIASLLPMDKPLDEAKATIPISDIRGFLSKKAGGKSLIKKGNLENVDNTIRGILGLKGQQSVKTSAIAETVSRQDVASKIEKRVELSIQKLIDNAASGLGKSLSIQVARKADNATVKSVGSASTVGSVFEGALSMLGAPMDTSKSEQDPIDFPNGLGPNFASAFQSLVGIPVDAKRTATKKILKDTASRKAASYLANAVYSDPRWQMLSSTSAKNLDPNKSYTLQQLGLSAKEAKSRGYRGIGGLYKLQTQNKNLGGIIQNFAVGGEAKKVADMMGKGRSIADSWWTGMFTGNNVLFDWGVPTRAFKIPTGEEIPIDQNLRKVLRERAQREWMAYQDKNKKATKQLTEEERAKLRQYDVSPEVAEKIKKEAEAKRAKAYADRTSRMNWDAEDSGRKRRRPEDYLRRARGFATGGGVGTDTVPALLTPGEFVINKKSAQTIGYGSLNKMNKVGKYAKGGVVQHFAQGTSGTGAQPISGGSSAFIPSQTLVKVTAQLDSLNITMSEAQSAMASLKRIAPTLYKALNNYANEANLTSKEQGKTALAYVSTLKSLRRQAFTVDEVSKTASDFAQNLTQSAKALRKARIPQAATAATAATSATTPTASVSAPVASPGLPRRQPGTQPTAPLQGPAPATAAAATATQQNTQAVTQNSKAQKSAAGSAMQVVNNNKMFAASMATSLIAGFLPAVDENSSATLRMTHAILGLITTVTSVGFALEAFGIKLKASSITDLFSKGAGKGISGLATKAGGAAGSAMLGMGGSAPMAIAASTFTSALTTVAVPIAAAAGTFVAVQTAGNALVDAFMNYEGQIKKAVEGGNIEKARSLGVAQQQSRTGVNAVAGASSGAVLGGMVGSLLGPLGTAVGAAIGGIVGGSIASFLSDSSQYAGQVVATQAALVKSQKALIQASEDASKALSDFEKGNISATDLLKSSSGATAAVAQSRAEANKLVATGEANRDSGFSGGVRNVLTLGGLIGESSGERDARITAEQQKSREGVQKQEEEAIRIAQPAMGALAKQVAMTNGSFDDLMNRIRETDPNLYDILIRQGTNDLNKSFQNISKEAARTKAALEATNLGLRGAQATSVAMSATMDRFTAGLEVGGNTFVANTEFLSQAMTSAAQAMNPDDIKAAVSDVSKNLSNMGISKTFTDKFEGNTNAFIQAQQNYGSAFDKIIKESKAMGKVFSAEELKTKFADQLGDMMGPDVSDDAKNNLKAIIQDIKLSPDEINEIMSGNYKAFGDKLTEAGQKQFEEIMKIAQERQKAEQVVIGLIQQRADAERNLAQAQKEAVDLYMEGRNVQAKYGGTSVSAEEKRGAILSKANASAGIAGVGAMRTGSAAELRQRQMQIVGGFANVEQRRSVDGGMAGREGVKASEMQKNLDQAQKDQVETIRSLIKLEEEELKILQEKNKMEKDSLESLISGDVEKFFEGQAASGAQAAIAAGDMDTANMFGAKAVADAFKDIQRQMEAGVQTMFGRQLGGPGGLAEKAAQASLSSRGITDPRMAQMLAGTTPEEEARKAILRELGGVLGEAGMAQVAMAEMQVQTANINVTNAELKLAGIEERGRQAAANMNRGGVVYANRGIFVPRGTDTVPAMLTPGEFVVRREAVNRGNNLQLLRAINNGNNASGMARGGKVGYYNSGGRVQYKEGGGLLGNGGNNFGIDPQLITNLSKVFTTFVTGFNESIKNLQNTKVQVQMSPTTVNVNFTGANMLNQISTEAKTQLRDEILEAIKNQFSVGSGGKLVRNNSNLPSTK